MTDPYTDALHTWEQSKIQLEESRVDYLDAKECGNSTSLFTAAVILADTYCLEQEAFVAYTHICNEDMRVAIQQELEAAS